MSTSVPHDLYRIASSLKKRYGDFSHHNKSNPLHELLFILCSTRTSELGYRRSYRDLMNRFPTFRALQLASTNEIAAAIQRGGLSNKKAAAIMAITDRLVDCFGRPTLAPLKRWSDMQCEEFLVSLP